MNPDKPPPAPLPQLERVLAVVAHPDDESFGLGAVLAALVDAGTTVSVLCLTRGEASTLGATEGLGAVRQRELSAAAEVLGVERTRLLHHPDGKLTGVSLQELTAEVSTMATEVRADALLVFDETGITGHPDHKRATAAAMAVADNHDLPVFAWTIPTEVADRLNEEFQTTFVGRPPAAVDFRVPTDRRRQRQAIACHVSQSTDNPVLVRRLELTGGMEHLRQLG